MINLVWWLGLCVKLKMDGSTTFDDSMKFLLFDRLALSIAQLREAMFNTLHNI